MKKLLVILVMVAGFVNGAMADNLSTVREAITAEQAPHFEVISQDEVPVVVMNAFDGTYQNIGIEKIEAAQVGQTNVYKFTIITYERKELTVYFTETGEEIKL